MKDNPFESILFVKESQESRKINIEKEAEGWINDLERPAKNLLELLRQKIDVCAYDSVLGDDQKARLHAIVLSTAIQKIYGERKKLATVFVQGGSLLQGKKPEIRTDKDEEKTHKEDVVEYLTRMKKLLGEKTLIVTEEIYQGKTIDALSSILHSLGVSVDAAAFGSAEEVNGPNPHISRGGTPVYIGWGRMGPKVPANFSGIHDRGKSGRGHSVPMDASERELESMQAARKAAKKLGYKLAEEFLSSHDQHQES